MTSESQCSTLEMFLRIFRDGDTIGARRLKSLSKLKKIANLVNIKKVTNQTDNIQMLNFKKACTFRDMAPSRPHVLLTL